MTENKHSDLDNLSRKNISDYEMPDKKGNWELFSHLLDEREKKIRIRRRLRFGLSVLILASAAAGFLFFQVRKQNDENGYIPSKAENKDTCLLSRENTAPNGSTAIEYKEEDRPASESSNANPSLNAGKEKLTGGNADLHPDHRTVLHPPSDSEADVIPPPGDPSGKPAGISDAVAKSPEPPLPAGNLADKKPVENPLSAYDFSSLASTGWENSSAQIMITNLGSRINSAYDDFAPIIMHDGSSLFFTSRRPKEETEKEKNNGELDRLYSSVLNKNNTEWTDTLVPGGFTHIAGGPGSVIGVSKDGSRMLLYRANILNGNGDIYESVLRDGVWTEPVKLPEPVNSAWHESSATLSPDARTIYFVSNRPGGKGGRDIWSCTRDANGKWGKAENLGERINTKNDEEGVFMHPDGKTLYFSSKGHGSLGGYDIYRSVFENGKWSAPFNPGGPLNTPGDDLFFVTDSAGVTGYYTSSGHGGFGGKDIYKVVFVPLQVKITK